MENPVNTSNIDGPKEMPQITPESSAYLLKAAKWGKFLSILGFIVAGLMVIAGLAMIFVFNALTDEMVPLNLPFPPAVFSVFYLLIAGIYIIPVIFLNRFCNNAIKALNNSSSENLTVSIRSLKNLFVFIGITTIVVLTIYTVVIIIAATAALATS
jgi:hypothetical protein